jgi:hypothetical protein
LARPGASPWSLVHHSLDGRGSARPEPEYPRSYDVEPRPASAEGTLPDVRGRRALAGAYRHFAVVWLPFCQWHDFDDEHPLAVALMAYLGRWADLSLWLHARISQIGWTISALLWVCSHGGVEALCRGPHWQSKSTAWLPAASSRSRLPVPLPMSSRAFA